MNYAFLGLYLFFTTIALIVYFFVGRRTLDNVYMKRGDYKYMECKEKMDRNYKLIAAVYVITLVLALVWREGLMYLFDKWTIPYAIVVLVVNVLLPIHTINEYVKDILVRHDYSKTAEYISSSQYADEFPIFLSCLVAPFFGFSGFFFKCSITYLI